MVQLAYVLVFTVIAAAVGLWVFTLYKLLPLYRSGAVQGGYRTAFQVAVALLAWVTMQIIVWLFLRQDAAAMMLTVLWAIGLLSWLIVSTVARTRRQMHAETPRAQPQPVPVPQATQRYKVRTRPHVGAAAGATASAARSARVRRIQSMEA